MALKSITLSAFLAVAFAHYGGDQDGCYMRFGEDKAKCDAGGPFCTWVSGPGWGKCVLSEEGRKHVAEQREHRHHDDDDDDDDDHGHGHHGGHGGSPVLCPFLKAVIPEAQGWMMRVNRLIEAMNDKACDRLPIAENGRFVVHKHEGHTQPAAHNSTVYLGRDQITRTFDDLLKHTLEVRLRGAYPDFARHTGMMAIQVFSQCPVRGQTFSSEWLLDIVSIGDEGIEEMELYTSAWQAVGGQGLLASGAGADGLVSRTVAALGQAVGSRNASVLAPMLDRSVHVELADAYFRQEEGNDAYLRDSEATSMDSAEKMLSFMQDKFAEQAKFMPLEMLEFGRGYYAGELGKETSAVVTGSATLKVIFSPKVVDWSGAVKVQASNTSGNITAIKLYPIEMSGLVEKWGWKYGGKGCFMHGLATAAFRISRIHPRAAMVTILGVLGASIFGVCCLAVRCCRAKRRVVARDLEAPLQAFSVQGASPAPNSRTEETSA